MSITRYNPQKIEGKWQKTWTNLYKAKDFSKKPKFYILVEFPYPSGEGLHVGHCRSFSAFDAVARAKRMQGFNVLYPMGWDAFGLPAENYAIKTGIHPSITVKENIANFKRQMKGLGLSFDWDREINTTDPKYYKWTQWIFLQLFKKGLAYKKKMPINWCPSCKIGLANEEVVDGKCERCGAPAEQREKEQWMMAITKYADRLIDDLSRVDYLEKIKTQQINWIGKSIGTEVDFKLENSDRKIVVFTTRVDTVFGVTAIVISPENFFAGEIVAKDKKIAVQEYVKNAKVKTEFERTKIEKEKTGVFTGSYCINPLNNEKVPVWIGDYVVASYGGGAVMMVPAHDQRDYEFAKKYGLEIKEVIEGGLNKEKAYTECGKLINSSHFSGLSSEEAIKKITQWLKENNAGRERIQYKLRDWVFSRQHYWGEPIPIIHCEKCGMVADENLPVKLPFVKNYQPSGTGESPLSAMSSWVNVKCPSCKSKAKRETDTMPNWAGSSWYFLRYADTKNDKALASKEKLKYWLPVDWYNGGMEHTTLHLLYSRFWHKFLYDIKAVADPEPYSKRTSHGIVLAQDGRKMSKSWGNVVNPDIIVKELGADTLRIYEMFMGPFDQAIAWDGQGVKGARRFLDRFWNLALSSNAVKSSLEIKHAFNKLAKKVTEDLEATKFNTAIASFMEFINLVSGKQNETGKDVIKQLTVLLAPFAPHIAEEIWHKLGNKRSVHLQAWPKYHSVQEEKLDLIIQINSKVRDRIEIQAGMADEKIKEVALSQEKIKEILKDKEIKKIIIVKGRLINIVV
ncbi:leucine--tRNA ligase [Patescibacteria group bacterium]|nr:leucine--tRNA ligase [Patescibacteria group bacterium]